MTDNEQQQSPSDTHEPSSIDMRTIGWSAIGLTVLMIASLLLMWQLLVVLTGGDPLAENVQPDVAPPVSRLANLPPLDADQAISLKQLQAEQQLAIETYQWVDEAGDIAQIPVDRAIEIIAEDGLPQSGTGSSGGGNSQ